MTRRRFGRLLLGGVALSALAGCAPPGPPGGGGATAPTASGSGRLLQNENRRGFFIRYYQPFEALDRESWALAVEGLVGQPLRLKYQEVRDLSPVSQRSRMTCVEGWSAAAQWEGFRFGSLLQRVEPRPEAKWVQFHCADGYYESMSVADLLAERILLAHGMNDQPLPDEYGAPLRLIVPARYGYKGPKAITRLVFAPEEKRGYWPTVGTYSPRGDILPGKDFPLDLEESRRIEGGEVRYPDGLESS